MGHTSGIPAFLALGPLWVIAAAAGLVCVRNGD